MDPIVLTEHQTLSDFHAVPINIFYISLFQFSHSVDFLSTFYQCHQTEVFLFSNFLLPI